MHEGVPPVVVIDGTRSPVSEPPARPGPPAGAAAIAFTASDSAVASRVVPAPLELGDRVPRPTRPRGSFRAMRVLHLLLGRNRFWRTVATWLTAHPAAFRAFTAAEAQAKASLFGCRMCGQCALPSTAYACPMTCPKQLRNGPCGGVAPDGSCEVYPGTRCVWLIAFERAEADGHVADLCRLQRPIDQRKWGQSSWVNYWLGQDEGLWTRETTAGGRAISRLELPILQSPMPPFGADPGAHR